jgi:glycosyltransferase involved in cell wall biosynthesis
MSINNYYLSFCVPVYNEEEIILFKINEIQKGLRKILKDKNFEILIVENGSTDDTLKELAKVRAKNVRVIKIKTKGHGLAMKASIQQANAEFVLLTAIDLPFGFSDLKEMLKIANTYDIIIGSKSHPKSITHSPLQRRISSTIYRLLLKIFFNVKVGDTQGTIFIKRDKILPLLKDCDAENAFFSAQLVIFTEKNKFKITEVPIKMEKEILRKSKYKIIRDGKIMLSSMLKTYLKTLFV